MEPQTRYCTTSDGASIAWAEMGPGAGALVWRPTPFTHAHEHWAIFGAFFDVLPRFFPVMYFDQRGVGMSERDVADVSAATLLMDAEATPHPWRRRAI